MAFVQTRTIVKKNLQNAQFRKRKHIFLVLNISLSLRGWGVEILEGEVSLPSLFVCFRTRVLTAKRSNSYL